MAQKQFERAEKINDQAEKLQAKSAQIIGGARKMIMVVLPAIILLLVYLTWLMFR